MYKYKGQIFIIGECFRDPVSPEKEGFVGYSERGERQLAKGLLESIPEQEEACKSHVDFINHFKDKIDFNIDVITYQTPQNYLLKEFYNSLDVKYTEFESPIGWENLLKTSLESLLSKGNLDELDFVFIFRIDLIFKDKMRSSFRYKSNCVLYPSILWKIMPPLEYPYFWAYPNTPQNGRYKVNDVFLFVPKARFEQLFDGQIKMHHHILYNMSDELYNNVSYFVNTYHDSDTEKDWNPLYKIANRPESKIWYSEGHIIEHGLADFEKD